MLKRPSKFWIQLKHPFSGSIFLPLSLSLPPSPSLYTYMHFISFLRNVYNYYITILINFTWISNKIWGEKDECYFYLPLNSKFSLQANDIQPWLHLYILNCPANYPATSFGYRHRVMIIFHSWSEQTSDSFLLNCENVKIGFEKKKWLKIFDPK